MRLMNTKKFKQVPSINRIGSPNPNIPEPVVISRGTEDISNEYIVTRPMRTDSRSISAGKPINWSEVYS